MLRLLATRTPFSFPRLGPARTLVALLILGVSAPAFAVDRVIEINQATVLAGAVTTGSSSTSVM